MNTTPQPPNKRLNPKPSQSNTAITKADSNMTADERMLLSIRNLKNGLRDYEIRSLVNESQAMGYYLKDIGLKTNQIRKFLDAVNRLKVELANDKDESFSLIKDEVFLLKPKLAYASARQGSSAKSPVQPLSKVLTEAIDKVLDTPDFYRLVQLIESIIAYHKAAGGKN